MILHHIIQDLNRYVQKSRFGGSFCRGGGTRGSTPCGGRETGGAEPRPYGVDAGAGEGLRRAGIIAGLMARNVGATLAVAREDDGRGTRVRFFAALRMTGTGGRGASRKFALRVRRPLRVLYGSGRNLAGGAEPRPYGVYISAEIIWWAIRESPLRS